MSDTDNRYRERDEPIKRLLLSSDVAEQQAGMVLLDAEFRERVVGYVRLETEQFATSGLVLTVEMCSDSSDESMKDVWQSTLTCVWEKVRNRQFKLTGSLFSYLVTIASRRRVDQWRKERRFERNVAVETFAVTSIKQPHELVEDAELFYDGLSEEEQVTLQLGLALAIANRSRRGRTAELTEKMAEIRREKGWNQQSPEAIARQYSRLLKRLCDFLSNRGYDV